MFFLPKSSFGIGQFAATENTRFMLNGVNVRAATDVDAVFEKFDVEDEGEDDDKFTIGLEPLAKLVDGMRKMGADHAVVRRRGLCMHFEARDNKGESAPELTRF